MLRVFRKCQEGKEEVYPVNGLYKVYELDSYELEYTSDSYIANQDIFLEDILLDPSIFDFDASQSKIVTIKPVPFFLDCFGFSVLKVNNEIFIFNVLIEKLKKNDAEDMLMYLWKKDRVLYNTIISKSSAMASNMQESEIGMTSKFINYANAFYKEMSEYSPSFNAMPHYVLRPKSELLSYSANLIDADSVPWILENLDAVSFDPEFRYDPDAIDFGGTYGVVDRLLVNRQIRCYNTYENSVILGGFFTYNKQAEVFEARDK